MWEMMTRSTGSEKVWTVKQSTLMISLLGQQLVFSPVLS